MRAEISFSQKMKAGWTKEHLMTHYALSEREYEKVMESLKEIEQSVRG